MMRRLPQGLRLLFVRGRTGLDARRRWLPALAVALVALAVVPSAEAATVTFSSQGCSLFQVPNGVSSIAITATGSAGSAPLTAGKAGGTGDEVSGTLSGLAGQTLDVCVDSGGGAGANDNSGNGGGASGVGLGSDFSAPVLIAGGGGGGGDESLAGGSAGANAGLPAGGTAAHSMSSFSSGYGGGGGGGTQTGVGAGGVNANGGFPVTGNNGNGSNGSVSSSAGPGAGGTGGAWDVEGYGYDGGGGGAGYYGGGGGAGAGGGGGSDFCASSLTVTALSGCAVVGNTTRYGEGQTAGFGASVELTFSGSAQPALALKAPSAGTAGTTISNSSVVATLTNATLTAFGQLTFTVYGPQANPPTDCSTGGTTIGTPTTVSGTGPYNPVASFVPSQAGTYYWYASYGGDPNDSAANSGCGASMPATIVAQTAPSLTLNVPSSDTPVTTISASSIAATLSAATASAAGTATFTVFGPQASAPTDCTTGGTTIGTATVSGNGSYSSSASFTPSGTGTYYWYVSYSGDSNNGATSSVCGASMPETVVESAGLYSAAGCSVYSVPNGVSALAITATGSAGGTAADSGGSGGTGDIVAGTLSGMAGQTLDVCVDQGGTGNGGGASAVALGSNFSNPVLIAGGGGGGGEADVQLGGAGGSAGLPNGGGGGGALTNGGGTPAGGGGGGTQTTYGSAGPGGDGQAGTVGSASTSSGPGAGGSGGIGANDPYGSPGGNGGGGGGGYYGGGGGGGRGYHNGYYGGGGGGGGGSDFCATSLTGGPTLSGCGPTGASNSSYGTASVYIKALPTISTKVSSPSVTVGASVSDEATLNGGESPLGTVTFDLYSSDITQNASTLLASDTEQLSGGKATSATHAITTAGTDYWVATYSGDPNNASVSSGAAAEPVTVKQASPSISSTAAPTSATVGGSVKDQATVSGGDNPTGSVTFVLYSSGTTQNVTTQLYTDTEPLSGGKATSGSYTTTATGTDYWVATYSGDTNNKSASTAATAASVAIAQASPSIALVAQPTSVAVGGSAQAEATVSNGYSPSGSVTFDLYANSSGTGTPLFSSTVSLSGGTATSASFTTTATGTDYWIATYNGDANNASVASGASATPVTVAKPAPSISSTAEPTSVTVGGSVKDQATVSGGDSPSGSVTFDLYANSSGTGTPLFSSTVSLSGGTAASASFTTTAAGTDYWVATYNGDANNASVASGAAATPVTVAKPAPSISSTAVPTSVTVGGSVKDQATVSGGDSPSGSVTFDLYANSSGTGTPLFSSTVSLSGGTATSASFTTTAAGTDYWVATYNGDANNASVSSGAAATSVTVAQPSASISSSAEPGSATIGDLVTDQVTVTGVDSPSGSVTFDLYSSKTVQNASTLVYYDTETLSDGTATAVGWTTSAPGTYYWVATYGGDVNNGSVTSAAAQVTVAKASPTISSSAEETSVTLGGEIWDQATVSGGYGPSGSVTFNVYSSKTIQDAGTLLHTDTEPLSDGSSAAAGYTTTTAGTEYWVATYDGDSNNEVVSSGAAADPVTVGKASPSISSIAEPQSATAGDAVTDQAQVYGNYAPSGSVTFDLYSSKTNQDSGTLLFSSTEPLSDGTATSASYTATAAGADYWVATYDGDSNNASVSTDPAADPVTIDQASPSIAFTLEPTDVTVGGSVQAKATVSGGDSPSGTVTFGLYDNAAGTGTPLFTGTMTLSGGTATTRTATTPSYTTTTVPAGGWGYWIATYNGDANNYQATTGGAVFAVSVDQAEPSVSASAQPATVAVGGSIKAEATVSGGYNPSGTVTFDLYNNSSASGTPLFTSTESVSGGTATSAGYTTTATGTDYWVASYSGDANNQGNSSATAATPVTVGAAASTSTTSTTSTTSQVTPSQVGSAARSTSTSVVSSAKAPTTGQPMTYTATITPTPDGGTVKFSYDGNVLAGCGAVAVDAGTASCQTSYAKPGRGGIQAAYSGGTDFNGSQSSALSELVRSSLTLLSARSTADGGIRFRVRCASGSGGCRVTAKLIARGASGHTTSLGVRRIVVAAGAKTTTIELSHAGRKLLASRGELSAQLTISLTVDGQTSTVATRRLKLHST
jgi:hypothetical protein